MVTNGAGEKVKKLNGSQDWNGSTGEGNENDWGRIGRAIYRPVGFGYPPASGSRKMVKKKLIYNCCQNNQAVNSNVLVCIQP